MNKILLTSLVSFASFTIFAGTEEQNIHPLDTDKDGLISIEEAKADITLTAIFGDLDINQDGYLSKLELGFETEEKAG
jgi:hypothetical protein